MSRDNSQDLLPLLVMLESIGKIDVYSCRFTNAADFFQSDDQLQFNASLLLLINVGEHACRLSEKLKNKYPTIPFQQIRGLRNRVAHDYTGIDYEMVFEIINKDIRALKPELVQLIQTEVLSGVFDREELNIARQSPFYAHIDFNELEPS
nr:HepT-like ribonuclease domain-containing protein [uncultured Dyadobacter sp.]